MPENPFIPRRRKQSQVPNMQSMLRRRVARKPGDTYGYREPFPMDGGGLNKRGRQPVPDRIPRPTRPNYGQGPQGQKGPLFGGGQPPQTGAGFPGGRPIGGGGGGGMRNPNQPGPNQNPSQHKPYWEAQGWQWNGTQFVRRGTGGRPNASGPGGGAGGGGGGGQGPGGPKPGPKPNEPGGGNNPPLEPGPPVPPGTPLDQLPLDAWFEAQRRMLDDQLSQRMAALSPLEQQIMAQKGLGEARLGTNEDLAGRSMREALAGRGMFGGGVQARDEGNLATDFMRQRQDLASGVAGQLSDVALQRSEAQGNYSSGLQEALLALAQRMAEDENAPVVVPPAPGAERPPKPNKPPKKPGKKPPTKGGIKPPKGGKRRRK